MGAADGLATHARRSETEGALRDRLMRPRREECLALLKRATLGTLGARSDLESFLMEAQR